MAEAHGPERRLEAWPVLVKGQRVEAVLDRRSNSGLVAVSLRNHTAAIATTAATVATVPSSAAALLDHAFYAVPHTPSGASPLMR